MTDETVMLTVPPVGWWRIANADEIFFINSSGITPAGSMEHAVEMLLHGKRIS